MKIQKLGEIWEATQDIRGVNLLDGTNIPLSVRASSQTSASEAVRICMNRIINHLILNYNGK